MHLPLLGAGVSAAVEPSSLLKLIAGDFAERIATLWPAPHTAFVTAHPARRHLVCLALAFGRDAACPRILDARMPDAVAAAVETPPPGLARAVARMGDVAWPASDYRTLLRMLADPMACKVLRHADAIELVMLRRLEALPPPMCRAAHLAMRLTDEGAAVLREAWEALRVRSGPAVADAAAARWAGAQTAKAVFAAARDDLSPEPIAPPFAGTARLKPLATKRALRDAARRFHNCLVERVPYASIGWSAYYEWVGHPGAIVEISPDHVFGWRLSEVRGVDNTPVPAPVEAAIVDELALMGVHVGRCGWELHRALHPDVGAAYPLRPVAMAAREAFVVA